MSTVPSTYVRSRLALMTPAAEGVAQLICTHRAAGAGYPELLRLLHQIIRSSVPLLEAVGERAAGLAGDDEVARGLVPYLREHAAEEAHHDEWLLGDYAALGLDPADVLRRPPSPSAAAVVGPIYYWCLNFHPVAILGYLAVMEGNPPSPALLEELQGRSGHPYRAFHTLRHHAAVDPRHGDELWELMDALPLEHAQVEFVATVAMHTLDRLVHAQLELLDQLDELLRAPA